MRLHYKTSLLAIGIFLFFGFLAYNTPLGGDDWAWGAAFGEEQWKNRFENYNGRYFSNSLVIALASIQWLRVLFMAVVSTLLVLLIGRLGSQSHQEFRFRTLAALILLLIVPVNIFGQTFGWLSGYVNYVFSAVPLLLYISINHRLLNTEPPSFGKRDLLLSVVLGLLTPLIVEHVTLFVVFTAFLTMLYTLVRFRKIYSIHLAYAATAIAGAALMFSNGAYASLFAGQGSYGRNVYVDRPEVFFGIYKEQITPILFIDSFAIHLVISGLMVLFLLQKKTEGTSPKAIVKYATMPVFLAVIVFFLLARPALGDYYFGEFTEDAEALFSIVYFIALTTALVTFSPDTKSRTRFAYYAIGVLLMTIPFVVLTPYGPRVAFSAYVFLVLIGSELAAKVVKANESNIRVSKAPFYLTAALLMMFYSFILFINGHTNRNRIADMQQALRQDEQTIELIEFPYPQYHWMPTPSAGNAHFDFFKDYYSIPENTEIEILPYFTEQKRK